MALTVRQLVDVPTLRTKLLAGEAGAGTEILWAHSCEAARPWEWLGRGDLLMTTGNNVPVDSGDQMQFVQSLAGAGVSGLVLAQGMASPALQPQTAALAEKIAFPILETAYEVPFVALARVVAAGQSETQARLNQVLRVYDAYRTAVQNAVSGEPLLRHISVELGHALHVVDTRSGRPVIAGTGLSADARAAIREQTKSGAALPGLTRVKTSEEEYLVLPIGTHPGWAMVASVGSKPFDVLLLQHVNTIVTIEAERIRADTETRLALSGRLMSHLIEGDVDSELVKERLADFGLSRGPWQVITAVSDPVTRPAEVQAALDEALLPYLVHVQAEAIVILSNGAAEAISAVAGALPASARIGVSNQVPRLSSVGDAVRQADWAREACRADGRRVAHYGQDRPLFLPPTVAEAENVVRTVLGALIDYDERQGTNLVQSLQVFFDANRSWQAASKQLQVHKQTLVYRMRRVSELTGRRLDHLDDVAELHLALRTRQLLQGD